MHKTLRLFITLKVGQDAGYKFWVQIDQANFLRWMSLLPSNLIEKISPNS